MPIAQWSGSRHAGELHGPHGPYVDGGRGPTISYSKDNESLRGVACDQGLVPRAGIGLKCMPSSDS